MSTGKRSAARGPAADEELRRQSGRLEPILDISPSAIVITDLDANVITWNAAAERLFGYGADEAIGHNLDDLVAKTEELHADAVEYSGRASKEHGHVHTITRRTRKDGGLVDVELLAAPLALDGRAVGTLGIYHDITELNRQRRFLEALLEVSPQAIITTTLDDIVASWNPAAERLFGYSAQEAVGRDIDDLVARRSDLYEEAKDLDRESLDRPLIHRVTQRTRKDGSLVDVDIVGGTVTVGGEKVAKHVFYHDITELQQQKRSFGSLLEISPAAIIVTDLDSNVVSWNPAAERLFEYRADEAIGRHLDDLVATRPEIHDEAVSYSERAAQGERIQFIARRTRKDGSLIDVQAVSEPVVVSEERIGYVVIYHDITELQQQKRYYEALAQFSPVAIALLDINGTVTSWNPAAERLFGFTVPEAIGRNIDELVASNDEIRAESEFYTERGLRGEPAHAFTRRTTKDGSFVDVEMFAAPVTVAGETAGFYAMYHDVRELQRARRDAEVAAEAKSAFLATMSHEIRTPLNAVIGMTGLLLDTELTADQRNFAEVIRRSGDALLGVINDILDFSKIEAGRLELENVPFDLRECVESALELVAAGALKKGLDLAYDLDQAAPGALVGDETRLRQILINLLNNAVKFTEKGEVVVTVTAERLDEADRYRLHFAVSDTGIGIQEDRMDRLFESFSQVDPSTTRRYGGTGLGLAISKRLVDLMAGSMWAESRPGQGSTFHFSVEAPASLTPVRPYERSEVPLLSSKRVLIVDDNATNRRILTRQMESWDMIASDTGSPAQALAWIRRGDPFDVAILDMQMPEMDGLALAREIRQHRNAGSLPLVMLTSLGRTEEAAVEFAAFLTKPIKPSRLFDALLGVFGGAIEVAEPAAAASADEETLAERLPLRILLVEDNAVNQQLALLLLQKIGYRVDVAGNGVEALDALERQPYDVVLMDVEMPEMDGLEATRLIHRRWSSDRPHIIAVTASALPGERELCLQAGMDDYITKPIRMEELTAALSRGSRRSDAVSGGQSIDPAVLRRLVVSLGPAGRESVNGLIDTFLRHLPEQLAAMRSAIDQGDVAEVRRGAHTLKSNAASFGASALADRCRELEALAKAGALEGAVDRLSGIEAELGRVTGSLEAIRPELYR
jgi:PAS domain S-box-containing protein